MKDTAGGKAGLALSREDIAKIEIGHTSISTAQKWTIVLLFLAVISVYPVCQFFAHQPLGEWHDAGTIQQSIKAYETAIEDTSLLRKWLLTPAQRFLTGRLNAGNEKVIIGKDGWLFYSGDYEYLVNRGFLHPDVLYKRQLKGGQPDPLKAILDFNRQLQRRGIRLILLPVPVKPMIYSDKLGGKDAPLQNPSFAVLREKLEKEGITVIDLAADFVAMRAAGMEPYLKTDTHWTPEGMWKAAEKTAAVLSASIPDLSGVKKAKITALGDIAAMLKLPDAGDYFPAETVEVADFNCRPRRESSVLLLGDSFANIYSLGAMNWGCDGGLAEAIGRCLGEPVDAILRNDAGAFATRQLLSNELKRGRDRLSGKKAVIYEFAIRELANGDWKMLEMAVGKAPETEFFSVNNGSQSVSGVVLAVSTVPRPNSAPYKDHVMSILLGDVNGGNAQALVYAVSMRDNVWSGAAGLRVGDNIRMKLSPWSSVESQYGAWNRSEFDSEELLLAEPVFGELEK